MTSKILRFFTDTSATANVLSQEDYAADADRLQGHHGITRSKLENKVLKQVSAVAAGLAEFMAANQPADVDDTLSETVMSDIIKAAIVFVATQAAGPAGQTPSQWWAANGVTSVNQWWADNGGTNVANWWTANAPALLNTRDATAFPSNASAWWTANGAANIAAWWAANGGSNIDAWWSNNGEAKMLAHDAATFTGNVNNWWTANGNSNIAAWWVANGSPNIFSWWGTNGANLISTWWTANGAQLLASWWALNGSSNIETWWTANATSHIDAYWTANGDAKVLAWWNANGTSMINAWWTANGTAKVDTWANANFNTRASGFMTGLGQNITTPGYLTLPTGLLLQWGSMSLANPAGAAAVYKTGVVTFPQPFTGNPFAISVDGQYTGGSGTITATNSAVNLMGFTNTTFTCGASVAANANSWLVFWIALGAK